MRHSSITGISFFHGRVYKAGNPGAGVTLAERSGVYQRLTKVWLARVIPSRITQAVAFCLSTQTIFDSLARVTLALGLPYVLLNRT